MGMKEASLEAISDAGRWPLVKLDCELEKVRATFPLTDKLLPVFNVTFDPYSRNLVAPDHLLAGIGKSIIEATFLTIKSRESSSKLDVLLCHDLRTLGLGSHGKLHNGERSTLNSMSMSTIYALISVLLPYMRTMPDDTDSELLAITALFTKLVHLTFWWPVKNIDGIDAF